MPLYEYVCHGCGKHFEALQKFSDEPIKTHEECGGEAERLMSPPALQFKGSGWYVTDYAKGGSSPVNGSSESKSESKTESKKETKTDSAPAATSSETKGSSSSTETK